MPPLALFDLDNTLIDRAAAFRSWAVQFALAHRLAEREVELLERLDGDGLTPRETFFGEIRARHGLRRSVDELVGAYRSDYPRHVRPPSADTVAALRDLGERGWRLGIVTNGAASQKSKIEQAGLPALVDGWAISELVGSRKPERAIFAAAAGACGCALDGAWVVGDSAAADIAGAAACGLRSVWISRGRRWEAVSHRPHFVADTVADAIVCILAATERD